MDNNKFYEILSILKPYIAELIVVGGWAPYIYHNYLVKNPPGSTPLGTMDVDLASELNIPIVDEDPIDSILAKAGFKCELFHGYNGPPVTKYVREEDQTEIEFITYKVGNDPKNAHYVQSGLSAQKLRYVNVLLKNTISISIKKELDNGGYIDLDLIVPHPARYIFQKILILEYRKREMNKMNKDLYYVFDLIANYPELYTRIIEEFLLIRNEYRAWFKRFVRELENLFESELSDGPSILDLQRPISYPSRSIFLRQSFEIVRSFISAINVPVR